MAVSKSQNRLLQITNFSIPYIKELKNLTPVKTTNACILMQQLEYWMYKYPKGFYKFQSRPLSTQYAYQDGDSWTEELRISEEEFRTAFDQIGFRYNSKKAYDRAKEMGEEFCGKYYCSYFNKVTRLTHYFRNNDLVEDAIDSIVEMQNSTSRNSDSNLAESTMPTSRDNERRLTEDGNISLESSETITNTKTENITEREETSALSNKVFGNEEEIRDETLRMEEDEPVRNEVPELHQDNSQQTKVAIPKDFAPTWDAKYRAVLQFPSKSVSWVTDKFKSHYEAKGLRMTVEQWHQKWWDWMQMERATIGNEGLTTEQYEIINYVADEVFESSYEIEDFIFDIDCLRVDLQQKYSATTLADILQRLYEAGLFGRVGDYYFNNKERDEWWSEILNEIECKGLDDAIIDVYSLPENKITLRQILEMRKKRAA